MWFDILLFVVGVIAGGIASVAGFGIGSFLTPVVALKAGFGPAIAAVSVVHMVGSLVRFLFLKASVNKKVLFTFGLVSALGGVVGALLRAQLGNAELSIAFGGLMILAGVMYAFHVSDKIKVSGMLAWPMGVTSGFFGGLVGNQGGLRAAALTTFRLKKTEFVATATAIALIVDIFRVPVYLVASGHTILMMGSEIGWMGGGVVVGTLLGAPILRKISDRYFTIVVSAILMIVGLLLILQI